MKAPGGAKARSNGASALPDTPGGSPATDVAGNGDLEERFAREFVVDLDGPAAYRRIRPDVTPASARTLASRLLTKVDVQNRIAQLKAEQFARLEITADAVLRELALVGFSDIGHYQVDPVAGRLTMAQGEPLDRRRAVASMKHRTRTGGHGDDAWTEHTVELRLWDKLSALVKLGEHLKLWKHDTGDRGRVEVIVDPDGTVRIVTEGEP